MPNEAVMIYVTKDAPVKGIRKVEAAIDQDGYAHPKGDWHIFRPTEFARTIEGATANAEIRRIKKLASLEKQIAAIRSIDLTKPVEG